ncbi:MAG: protein kinase [Pseudomonadota bacterium]
MNPTANSFKLSEAVAFVRSHEWIHMLLQVGLLVGICYVLYRFLMSHRAAKLRARIPWLATHYGKRQIHRLVEAGEYAQAGDLLVALGQLDQAIEVYQEGNLFGRAGDVYLRRRQYEKAAALFERAGESRKAAELFVDLKDFERAEACLERGNRASEIPDLYRKRGDLERAAKAHLKTGSFEAAAQIYSELRKPLRAAEVLIEAHNRLKMDEEGLPSASVQASQERYLLPACKYLEAAGDYARAAQLYAECARHADSARLFAKAGDRRHAAEIYEQLGDLAKAAALFGQEGDQEAAKRLNAESLFQQGRLKESAELFEEIGDFTRAAELHKDLNQDSEAARIYEKGGDFQMAAELYDQMERYPEAARAYEQAKIYEKAVEAYRRAGVPEKEIELLEQSGDRVGLASVLHRLGRRDEALKVLEQMEPGDPRFQTSLSLKGRILLDEGDPLKAKECFERALDLTKELKSDDIDMIYNLALVAEQTQTQSKALQILEKMLAQDLVEHSAVQKAENVRKLLAEKVFTKMSQVLGTGSGSRMFAASEAALSPNATQPIRKRYGIVKEIGRGGMGVVYLAKDQALDRLVALKVLHSSFKKNEQAVQTFLREAKSAAALNHPNIVTIHDTGTQDGEYYIAMELIEGRTIKQILKAKGRLSYGSVSEVLRQLLEGLAYAHSMRIVHRDLSTNNIMWTKQKVVKIMDFGLAKMVRELASEQSIVGGTPSYMSPEQTLGTPIDHRSDIYSLGICIYEMALGELPFKQGDMGFHHLHTAPPIPKEQDPQMPEFVNRTIRKCLEKKPEDRFQSVTEIQALMKQAL